MINACNYLKSCVFFNDVVVLPNFVKDTLKKRYCLDDFARCMRKAALDAGEEPPDNMVPDGRIIASRERLGGERPSATTS